MKINLLSCEAQKPDRRAIANCIYTISAGMDEFLAREITSLLLDGEIVEIDLVDNNTSSAFRALRKLSVDYEILD